ncbi:MAG: OmpH family outer membrane protein [Lewinella sp.]|nr:OmpH family outer membrane protein [Lewinella sp.]
MSIRQSFFIACLAFFGFGISLSAQKIAVVDVERILNSITEYQDAQKDLDNLAAKWRQEINQEYDVIKGMYNKFQAEQVLLTPEQRQAREKEILDKETAVRELQRNRFGPEGGLFKRRQELVKPIQDAIYEAIEQYADTRGYDLIFDRAGSAGIIFSKDTYDKTDDILRSLQN